MFATMDQSNYIHCTTLWPGRNNPPTHTLLILESNFGTCALTKLSHPLLLLLLPLLLPIPSWSVRGLPSDNYGKQVMKTMVWGSWGSPEIIALLSGRAHSEITQSKIQNQSQQSL